MGLAASQARFLGITARKSNIEYEGQQVNQQRTALAEEVNALYSKLTALKVPVAPSAQDFYTTNYSFTIDSTSLAYGDYKITNYYQTGSTYHVDGTRTYTTTAAIGTWIDKSTINQDEEGNYTYKPIGGQKIYTLTELTNTEEASNYKALMKEAGAYKYYDEETGTYKDLPDEEIAKDSLYFYEEDGQCFYFSKYQMDNRFGNINVNYYTISGNVPKTENFSWDQVNVQTDANGRLKSISKDGLFSETPINTTKTYDTEGYEEALRHYTMSKDEYDKAIEDINAKTKSLQQEDKVLELRLNQIDTEQNELATELDAVKEVLDKNIENTFKTFA